MIASVLLYLVLVLAYVAIRPPLSYNEDGSMKPFGVGKGHTLFPLWVVAILAAVIVAFLYAYITV
jgi:hypothetical protein